MAASEKRGLKGSKFGELRQHDELKRRGFETMGFSMDTYEVGCSGIVAFVRQK